MGKGDRQVPGKRESKLKLASGFRYINQVLVHFFFFFFIVSSAFFLHCTALGLSYSLQNLQSSFQ